MFNFKKIRSLLALFLLFAMLLSTLAACDISSLFIKKKVINRMSNSKFANQSIKPLTTKINNKGNLEINCFFEIHKETKTIEEVWITQKVWSKIHGVFLFLVWFELRDLEISVILKSGFYLLQNVFLN